MTVVAVWIEQHREKSVLVRRRTALTAHLSINQSIDQPIKNNLRSEIEGSQLSQPHEVSNLNN